jgi:hypothetical protein
MDIIPEIRTYYCLSLVGTTTIEHSFSQMKLVKTRLRSRISDSNLARLMHIANEGLQLYSVP